jgi:hypothetical protein
MVAIATTTTATPSIRAGTYRSSGSMIEAIDREDYRIDGKNFEMCQSMLNLFQATLDDRDDLDHPH